MLLIGIVQLVMNILGWLSLAGALLTFIVGNRERSLQLLIGGIFWLGLKYLVGFITLYVVSKQMQHQPNEDQYQTSPRYNQLIQTLSTIKGGTNTDEEKAKISKKLVHDADVSDWEKNDLLDQINTIYRQ